MSLQLKKFTSSFKSIAIALSTVTALVLSSMTLQSAQAATDPNEVSVVKRASPIYPLYAVKNKLEGAVLLSFSIEKDGNVSDIQVEGSDLDGIFDASAILGVQRWVYTKPVKKLRNNYVAIEFVLTDKSAVTAYANVERIRINGNK
ncbi:MAG: energy transducer TonB [Psychrobium sp.]